MRPVWLIEAEVYGAEADPLVEEIRRQGMACAPVHHRTLVKGPLPTIDGGPLGDGACVIAYGTFPFLRQIQLHQRWVPGGWGDAANLDCLTYYAYFGPYLLSQDYAIMPGVEAIRRRDWIYRTFGRDDEVFARPTGCHKLFVGRRVARTSFAEALASTRFDPATPIVVASPRPIGREWRLVVAGDRVIAASQYAQGGSRAVEPGCPDEVVAFAESMLAAVRWRPDPIFMMDVGESAGRTWLIELNGFSCSWLYLCDLAAVVGRAGELAVRAWEAATAARGRGGRG